MLVKVTRERLNFEGFPQGMNNLRSILIYIAISYHRMSQNWLAWNPFRILLCAYNPILRLSFQSFYAMWSDGTWYIWIWKKFNLIVWLFCEELYLQKEWYLSKFLIPCSNWLIQVMSTLRWFIHISSKNLKKKMI